MLQLSLGMVSIGEDRDGDYGGCAWVQHAAESMGIDVLWTGMGTGKVVLMLWWGSKAAAAGRNCKTGRGMDLQLI